MTVIAAHAALPLFPPPLESDRPYRELVSLFQEAGQKGWELYADLSAITLGPRGSYVDDLKRDIPPDRLGYRNRLTHHYDEVTPQELFAVVSRELPDLESIARELSRAAAHLAGRQ